MCYHALYHLFAGPHGGSIQSNPEGNLDFRRFGGTLHHRTAFSEPPRATATLCIDEQVRRYEVEGLVEKVEWHEYLGAFRTMMENVSGGLIQNKDR